MQRLEVVHSAAHQGEAAELVRAEVELVRAAHRDLAVIESPVHERAEHAMRERATSARMLVLGSGSGPITRRLVEVAGCPVVVSGPVPVDPSVVVAAAGAAAR